MIDAKSMNLICESAQSPPVLSDVILSREVIYFFLRLQIRWISRQFSCTRSTDHVKRETKTGDFCTHLVRPTSS